MDARTDPDGTVPPDPEPPLLVPPPAGGAGEPKRVEWAELFFDLVFVFAVTQVSALLHHDHSWAGAARALVVFVPVYWAWVGTSVHADTRDAERPAARVAVFAIGLCALFMALATPLAYGDRGLLFGASYCAARLLLAALMLGRRWWTLSPFSVAVVVSGPLLLAGGLVDDAGVRVLLWALAGATDLLTPRLLRSRLMGLRFDPGHMPERFGLFLLIAMGESVVATGAAAAAAPHLSAGLLGAVAAAFALVCALWWVYYHFAASAVQHALRTAAVQTDVVRQVLSYGHLAFIVAIIIVATGLHSVVGRPGEHLHPGTAALLVGGCALYLATFGYTRWRMFRKVAWTRLAAALVVLPLLPAAPHLPALATVALLALLVGVLNVVEFQVVQRRGGL
ncbi:low temperature requirement protein A [Actinomadura parmotrematis]|uniref:Low temperature requirement protein A n=1 Tax=Actinomadura parmotrematis TaxID=2864039 RepID=A0ABS7FU83_9ACTN|nr:low temperature requirement protein A [Actinomadura parmotrematis]MBW8483965.1 low temperature requirement protein A [Actinomadura parmotrematis]